MARRNLEAAGVGHKVTVHVGAALDEGGDEDITGIRKALDILGTHPRLEATALQTVGSKDWDGLALAIVT